VTFISSSQDLRTGSYRVKEKIVSRMILLLGKILLLVRHSTFILAKALKAAPK
jgi:hypothetical protein